MRQVLAWALGHDAPSARCGWRTRWAGGGGCAAGWLASTGCCARWPPAPRQASEGWCAAQCWLGWAALLSAGPAAALGHFTAVLDAVGDRGPSRVLADALAGRSTTLQLTGRLAEGAEEARRSLAVARELGYLAGEGMALDRLAMAASYGGDFDGAVQLIRQQEQLIADIPGPVTRGGSTAMVSALIDAGDLAAAETRLRGGAGPVPGRRRRGLPAVLADAGGGSGYPGGPYPGRRSALAGRAPGRPADRRLV